MTMMNNGTSTVIRGVQATRPWDVSVSKWSECVSRQIRAKRLDCLRLVQALSMSRGGRRILHERGCQRLLNATCAALIVFSMSWELWAVERKAASN